MADQPPNDAVPNGAAGLYHRGLVPSGRRDGNREPCVHDEIVYDEMLTDAGVPRPVWQSVMDALGRIGADGLGERREEARRLLYRNGVTYNNYADPRGTDRPWPLDLVPLPIGAREWRDLEAGLIQRATLLNTVLRDLYGAQTLIASGRLPPALVHANRGFLRACHGVEVPHGIFLHLYAADLVRGSDGRWRVLSDRTQTPAGVGYALENRSVVSRVMQDIFEVCNVRRLTPFFDGMRRGLAALAGERDDPRIVLLTPGPYNEAYFEHAYLARRLGVTLVEGADLTLRDGRVFLKTLGGLDPVDVILRRQDDAFCDPLDLRPDSSLGIAGLVQAVRAGTVAVANALGSGVMESMGFKPFLSDLAPHLLGEELRMPAVPTWWCGREDHLAHVLDNLERLVIKPACTGVASNPVFGADLSPDERHALAARIRNEPHAFMAQDQVALSTIPVLADGHLEPRPLVLRVYVAATPDGYVVMPGGLTRFSREARTSVVSIQHGGGSKDTWVTEATPTGPSGPRAAAPPACAPASHHTLPSRIADHLLWLGRYAERSGGTARVLRCLSARLADDAHPGATAEAGALLRLAVWLGLIPPANGDGTDPPEAAHLHTDLQAALSDPGHPNGLRTSIRRLHRAAVTVRDRLSADQWRVISRLEGHIGDRPLRIDATETLLRLDDVIGHLAALTGLTQDGMIRGTGWRFLDMGRRLERALYLTAVIRGVGIDAPTGDMNEEAALEVMLELADSITGYRERCVSPAQRLPALRLLLVDDDNPRALSRQLRTLAHHLDVLAATTENDTAARAKALIDATGGAVREMAAGDLSIVAPTLDRVTTDLFTASDLVANAFFSHAFTHTA